MVTQFCANFLYVFFFKKTKTRGEATPPVLHNACSGALRLGQLKLSVAWSLAMWTLNWRHVPLHMHAR